MPGPVFLEGEAVTLRPIEEDDLDFLQTVINHPDVREGIAAVEPVNGIAEREWLERDRDGVRLLVTADDERVGSVSYRSVNEDWGTAELAYSFHPDAWGNGYATDAVDTLVRYGFEDRRIEKFWARVFGTNPASQQVLEKVGFEREGTFRDHAFKRCERVDLHQYGLLVDEWGEN